MVDIASGWESVGDVDHPKSDLAAAFMNRAVWIFDSEEKIDYLGWLSLCEGFLDGQIAKEKRHIQPFRIKV